MAKCNWTPQDLREQELFEAAVRKRFPYRSLSYRYMEEQTREYDNPYTSAMFAGWLMRSRIAGVETADPLAEPVACPNIKGNAREGYYCDVCGSGPCERTSGVNPSAEDQPKGGA